MIQKRAFFSFLSITTAMTLLLAVATNVMAHGIHTHIDSKTSSKNGSSNVVIEQKIISNSNSDSTIVKEFKSENGKVIIDKTYTSVDEGSSLDDLKNLESEIENQVKERMQDAQQRIDDANEIEENTDESDKSVEEISEDLENLESEIDERVEERMNDLDQDNRSWWQRFRSWLNGRLKSILEK